MGLSYEEGKKAVVKGFIILLGITLLEVAIALFWKVGMGSPDIGLLSWWFPLTMILLSALKAIFIVSEFMHMKYEVGGLRLSVLLPLLLLVWGIIAFLWEGDSWKERRLEPQRTTEKMSYKAPVVEQDAYQIR